LRIAREKKEKKKEGTRNSSTGTDQKKEPVVHEIWASDIALEGLVAILSG
jgi:hypothetical protein